MRGAVNDGAHRLSLGCRARGGDGGPAVAFPLGAWVPDEAELVDGRALERSELRKLFPRQPAAIVRTALELFAGTSYQWGGVTPWGADCSGLVQTAFRLHGVRLPRDAWQQALVGSDAGHGDPTALHAADLLFFSDREDRRITHVGISLGGAGMVHLALGRGGYAVERLDDGGDPYVAGLVKRFVGARRVV